MAARLLVVEDEINFCNAIKAHLEQEGFEVDAATDGESGLDLIMANTYAAVVTDLTMPGMSGAEMMRKAAADGRATPTLVICGQTDVALPDTGAPLVVLAKPAALADIAAKVRGLVGG